MSPPLQMPSTPSSPQSGAGPPQAVPAAVLFSCPLAQRQVHALAHVCPSSAFSSLPDQSAQRVHEDRRQAQGQIDQLETDGHGRERAPFLWWVVPIGESAGHPAAEDKEAAEKEPGQGRFVPAVEA